MEKTLSHWVTISQFVSEVLNSLSEEKQSKFMGQDFDDLSIAPAMEANQSPGVLKSWIHWG